MKDPTEFNLNAAIVNWRAHLSQAPQFRAENLNELESHLRDSVAVLGAARLTDEEAFLVAARRMGPASALAPEFAKVNAGEVWLRRALWMLLGIQAWGVVSGLARLTADLSASGLAWVGMEFAPPASGWLRSLFGNSVSTGLVLLGILIQGLALVGITMGGYWLARRNDARVSRMIRNSRPVGWVVVLLALGVVLLRFASSYGPWLLLRGLDPTEGSRIMMSRNAGAVIVGLLQPAALIALTVFLARRRCPPERAL